MNLACPLERHARTNGSQVALIESNTKLTYHEFDIAVGKISRLLIERGIKPRDRVAVHTINSLEQVVFLYALWRLKAIACPINRYQPEGAIKEQVSLINAKFLVTDEAYHPFARVQTMTLSEIFSAAHRAPEAKRQRFTFSSEQPVTILFTSGSSDVPKAALHSFGNYFHNALASNRRLGLRQGDRWLLSLPLYHVGGLGILFRALFAGATIVIPKNKEEAFDWLSRDKITHVSLVPTQLYRLLQKNRAYRSLKCILVGGAPIPRNLIAEALKRRWPVYTTYGLTETTSQVATSKASERAQGAMFLPCISVKISSKSEIMVKGSVLFKGYVSKNAVRLPLTKDGWFNTHDLGEIKQGRLTVFGRQDNQFISGGENIQPEEIERHLLEYKGIAQACVVPRKDKEFGERPVAFIQFTGDKRPSRKTIQAFLRKKVAGFKIPQEFYGWPKSKSPEPLKMSRRFAQDLLKKAPAKLSPIV